MVDTATKMNRPASFNFRGLVPLKFFWTEIITPFFFTGLLLLLWTPLKSGTIGEKMCHGKTKLLQPRVQTGLPPPNQTNT
jgi:hypothetical protein